MARTEEVSSTRPCGIMPKRAPTVDRMAAETSDHAASPDSSQAMTDCRVPAAA